MRGSVRLPAHEVRAMIGASMDGSEAAQLLHRLDAVLLVSAGCSCRQVAAWFGLDRRTVQRWVHNAGADGLSGLAEGHGGGRRSALTAQRLEDLRGELQAAPSALGYPGSKWSGKRLALHLSIRYGVSLSVRSCQRLIASLHPLAN